MSSRYSAEQMEVVNEFKSRVRRRARNMINRFNEQYKVDLAQLQPDFMDASIKLHLNGDGLTNKSSITKAAASLHAVMVEVLSENDALFEDVVSVQLIQAQIEDQSGGGSYQQLEHTGDDTPSDNPSPSDVMILNGQPKQLPNGGVKRIL
jgi:hypothetical protein